MGWVVCADQTQTHLETPSRFNFVCSVCLDALSNMFRLFWWFSNMPRVWD